MADVNTSNAAIGLSAHTIAETQNATHFDRLSDLPAELRLDIYTQLFTSFLGLATPLQDLKACQPTPPILRTSRLLRREALPVWSQKLDEAVALHDTMNLPLYTIHLRAAMIVCRKEMTRQAVTEAERQASDSATRDLDANDEREWVLRKLVRASATRSRDAD